MQNTIENFDRFVQDYTENTKLEYLQSIDVNALEQQLQSKLTEEKLSGYFIKTETGESDNGVGRVYYFDYEQSGAVGYIGFLELLT